MFSLAAYAYYHYCAAFLQYQHMATIHWSELEGAITKLAAAAATNTINDNNNAAALAAMMSSLTVSPSLAIVVAS
jgi:hypothetical protein